MPIAAFDVDSSNKAGFNFRTAYAQGYRVALIKFGGMNISGNRPYRMNGYQAFVDAAFDAGFKVVGDYIVTGGSDPAGAARFWLGNHDPRISFHVLDNEVLDSGNIYTDGQASLYFDTIGPVVDRWQYGSRDSLWNARSWPGLTARGIKAHVAIYNDAPLANCYPRTYPAALVKGHQFTSSASIGGLSAVDANAFTDDAFTTTTAQEGAMAFEMISNGTSINFVDEFGTENIANYISSDIEIGEYVDAANTVFGTYKTVTSRQFDIAVAIAERRRKVIEARLASNAAQQVLTALGTDIAPTVAAALQAAGVGGVTPEQLKTITDAIEAKGQQVIAAIPTAFTATK